MAVVSIEMIAVKTLGVFNLSAHLFRNDLGAELRITPRRDYRLHRELRNFGVSMLSCYAVITIAIRLRYDYDPTTTYFAHASNSTRAKNEHVNFSS